MRKEFAITIFLIYFNAGALLLEVSGIAASWGVESPTGTVDAFADFQQAINGIQASGGLADTLFGSFAAITSIVEVMVRVLVAGPLLLNSAGVPAILTAFLFAPVGVIAFRAIGHALAGRFA
jgi:hypothetical protein